MLSEIPMSLIIDSIIYSFRAVFVLLITQYGVPIISLGLVFFPEVSQDCLSLARYCRLLPCSDVAAIENSAGL